MFSFLYLLYTDDFKADRWILITVKTEDLNFCLQIYLRKPIFLGLMESSLSVTPSVNGQTRKREKKKKRNDESETQ